MNFARAASTVRTVAKSALDLLNPLSYRKRPQHSRLLLKDFSGSIRAGEMLLVIGKPGSGRTAFLKALSNMRGEYKETSGEVSYGGRSAKHMAKMEAGTDLRHLIFEQILGLMQPCSLPWLPALAKRATLRFWFHFSAGLFLLSLGMETFKLPAGRLATVFYKNESRECQDDIVAKSDMPSQMEKGSSDDTLQTIVPEKKQAERKKNTR